MLGVSDSLVSDYRKRIEANLQQLSFNGVNEASQFEKALKRRVREMLAEKEEVAGKAKLPSLNRSHHLTSQTLTEPQSNKSRPRRRDLFSGQATLA